jgi:hypothetical protein
MTGDGFKDFIDAVETSRDEYNRWVKGNSDLPSCQPVYHAVSDYLPELQRARAAREKSLQEIKDDSINRVMKDLAIDREKNPDAAMDDTWGSDDGEDDDADINLIDKS